MIEINNSKLRNFLKSRGITYIVRPKLLLQTGLQKVFYRVKGEKRFFGWTYIMYVDCFAGKNDLKQFLPFTCFKKVDDWISACFPVNYSRNLKYHVYSAVYISDSRRRPMRWFVERKLATLNV